MVHSCHSLSRVLFPQLKVNLFFPPYSLHPIVLVQWMYNCVLFLTPSPLFQLLPLCLLLSLCVAYQCAVLNLSVNKSLSFLSVLLRRNKHCIDYNLYYYYVAIEILHVIIDTMMTWIMMTNCYWKLSENIKKFIIKTLYDAKQAHLLGRRPLFLCHWC